MYEAFCHTCQIFLQTPNKYCEKCGNTLEIIKTVSTAELNSTLAAQSTVENFAARQENYTAAKNNSVTESYSTQSYSPNSYQTPRYRSNYNSSVDLPEEANSKAASVAVKLTAVFIVLIIIGFAVTYIRNYFASLPERRVNQIMEARNNPGHTNIPQTPWFYSWFRSEPTADEVFAKYEEVTQLKGKKITSESLIINGNLEFSIGNADLSKTYEDLKFGSGSDKFYSNGLIAGRRPDLSDFRMNFEMSLKAPNKIFFKMEMLPKDQNIKNVKLSAIGATDGEKGWSINNALINGQKMSRTQDLGSKPPFTPEDTDFLTMTIVREMYQSIEFMGTETIAGRQHYFIKATKTNGQLASLYFDTETGLINKYVGRDGEVYVIDYTMIDNCRIPSKVLMKEKDRLVLIGLVSIKRDVSLDDSIFLQSSYQ